MMVYTLLLAGSGILFGYLLGLIAPEELPVARKYLPNLKRLMLLSLIMFTVFLVGKVQLYYAGIMAIAMISIFTLNELKYKKELLDYLYYLFFVVPYVLQPEFRAILATLIFLYGFPIGTLLYNERS